MGITMGITIDKKTGKLIFDIPNDNKVSKFEKWLLENNIKYTKMYLGDDNIPSFGVSDEHHMALGVYTMGKKYDWEYRDNNNYILIKVYDKCA